MLVENIRKVRLNQAVLLNQRLNEFRAFQNASKDAIFLELCFCLLTANFSAQRSINIHQRIGTGFLSLSKQELAAKLKELGYRFPNTRANYIVLARELKDSLELNRDWLVQNIKGLGMKESSHFLRNIGFTQYAIIDFHIIDLLVREGLIERPKYLNKKEYLRIEELLKGFSSNLAELDLILWFLETGKILK